MSNTRKPKADAFDWDALVAEPKRATTAVALCFAADLNGRYQELAREVGELTTNKRAEVLDDRMVGGAADPRLPLAQEMRDIEERMAAATQTVELQAMGRRDFRALCLAHPPRPGLERDKTYGVNEDEVFPLLLAECATHPKRPAEWWATVLDDVLNDGQYERLTIAAWNVNRGDAQVPFSQLASVLTASTGTTSTRRTGSASPRSASTGGSPPPSPSTDTTAPGD